VISSIERHTSGAEDMSDLDMIVYVADAIEPSRDFPTVDDLRKLVGKVSLEELFFAVFRGTFMGLLDGRRLVHPGTEKVWNYYAARARARGKDKKNRKKGNK
jgi:HD superfamily phosphohydrolase YqeK